MDKTKIKVARFLLAIATFSGFVITFFRESDLVLGFSFGVFLSFIILVGVDHYIKLPQNEN